jgi:histidine ammonia-lyase
MLVLKVHTLCFGYSGISLKVVERICWHLEHNCIPPVPAQGSVGASGDLAPLAHLFLPLIGLGMLSEDSKSYRPTSDVLKMHQLSPLKLGPKEGVALINGTQFISAHAIAVSEKFARCLDYSDLIGALSLEAMLESHKPFAEKLHQLRPHPGALTVAKRMRTILKGSQVVKSHEHCGRVQGPYSVRCIPQVHGASRDTLHHLNKKLVCELNSVTDNPVIFNAEDTISGGNFHGQPLAMPLDYASLAASELGSISERRTYLLLGGDAGLPTYLIKESGLNSGFMITQYCAAALVSENKSNCFPASADSIPTSMGQEDHVSMGSISGRKALTIVKNLEKILAIELLCSAQAFDFRRPVQSSEILERFHSSIRKKIPHLKEDTVMSDYIEMTTKFISNDDLLKATMKT